MARHAVGGGASGHGGACGGRWGERARRGAGRGARVVRGEAEALACEELDSVFPARVSSMGKSGLHE